MRDDDAAIIDLAFLRTVEAEDGKPAAGRRRKVVCFDAVENVLEGDGLVRFSHDALASECHHDVRLIHYDGASTNVVYCLRNSFTVARLFSAAALSLVAQMTLSFSAPRSLQQRKIALALCKPTSETAH